MHPRVQNHRLNGGWNRETEEEWEGEEKGIGIKASGKVRREDESKH